MDSVSYTPIELEKPSKKKYVTILLILLAIVSVCIFIWVMFLRQSTGSKKVVNPFSDLNQKAEKNMVPNPLTGEMVDENAVPWAGQRPMGVMVNNHVDARPQSGLIYADLVYEIVAEGGITRFLSFYLSEKPTKIGPVRSTREYYLVLVKELGDAMLMHIGYSPQALTAIETWPVRSLSRGGATFWRDNPRNVATEHTAYVDGEYLRELGETLGWEGVGKFDVYKFKDDSVGEPTVTDISIDFWYEGDYSAIFKYNSENNTYLRFMGYNTAGEPIPHVDQETGDQIEIKNLIVQFVTESYVAGDDKSRLEYQLIGSGDGLVFIDGGVTPITWVKDGRDSRTMFYDLDGKEIEFNRGKFWISIVPDRNMEQVVY